MSRDLLIEKLARKEAFHYEGDGISLSYDPGSPEWEFSVEIAPIRMDSAIAGFRDAADTLERMIKENKVPADHEVAYGVFVRRVGSEK